MLLLYFLYLFLRIQMNKSIFDDQRTLKFLFLIIKITKLFKIWFRKNPFCQCLGSITEYTKYMLIKYEYFQQYSVGNFMDHHMCKGAGSPPPPQPQRRKIGRKMKSVKKKKSFQPKDRTLKLLIIYIYFL